MLTNNQHERNGYEKVNGTGFGGFFSVIGCMTTSLFAMENKSPTGDGWPYEDTFGEKKAKIPKKVMLTLQADDGLTVTISRELVELSDTLRHMAGGESSDPLLPITLPNINGTTLKAVVELMTYAYDVITMDANKQIDLISAEVNKRLASIEDGVAFINAVFFLEIGILNAPVAGGIIEYLHAMHQGNRELISKTISGMAIPDTFKGLLAKYWYLNYGENRDFILPDLKYDFSPQELQTYAKLGRKLDSPHITTITLKANDDTLVKISEEAIRLSVTFKNMLEDISEGSRG